LDLIFTPFEVAAVTISVLIVGFVTMDGAIELDERCDVGRGLPYACLAARKRPPASFSHRKHAQHSPLGKRAVLAARDGRLKNATSPVLPSAAALLSGFLSILWD